MKPHRKPQRTRWLLAMLLALCPVSSALRAQDPAAEPRISLQLAGADIRDALRMAAKQGGVNLVMSNAVQGSVTLELERTTLRETLDALVHVGGFEYTLEGKIVTVSTLEELIERERQRQELEHGRVVEAQPPGMEALVVQLRYVDADRVLPVVEKMIGEGGSVSLLMTADHVARNNPFADNRQGYQQQQQQQNDSELQIGSRLSSTTQGQPAKSHTLVVVDVPARLDQVRAVVAKIDVKPVQILIESRFVEIALNDETRLGIDWNAVASAAGAATPHTFPFMDSSLGSSNPNVVGGSPNGGVFPPAPNSVSTPGERGLFTFGTLDFTAFTAVLRMIQRDRRVQLVSNPRIVVDDRHTATILIGERYPILSANISEFGTVTEQLDHYEPIGVQLEVTPSVLDDGEVELIVRPSTSSLGPEVSGSTGLTVSRINARQIDTSVTARNSETLVLGGLITTREVEEESRVPYVGAIPLVGRLFRYTAKTSEKVELVVFLTVTIIEPSGLNERERRLFESAWDNARDLPLSQLEFSPAKAQQ